MAPVILASPRSGSWSAGLHVSTELAGVLECSCRGSEVIRCEGSVRLDLGRPERLGKMTEFFTFSSVVFCLVFFVGGTGD